MTDPDNCGMCGNECRDEYICHERYCVPSTHWEHLYNCVCQWGGSDLDYEVCAPDPEEAQDLAKEACDEAHAEDDPCTCPSPCTIIAIECP